MSFLSTDIPSPLVFLCRFSVFLWGSALDHLLCSLNTLHTHGFKRGPYVNGIKCEALTQLLLSSTPICQLASRYHAQAHFVLHVLCIHHKCAPVPQTCFDLVFTTLWNIILFHSIIWERNLGLIVRDSSSFTSPSPHLKSISSFLNVLWIWPLFCIPAGTATKSSLLSVTTVYHWPPQFHSFMP